MPSIYHFRNLNREEIESFQNQIENFYIDLSRTLATSKWTLAFHKLDIELYINLSI